MRRQGGNFYSIGKIIILKFIYLFKKKSFIQNKTKKYFFLFKNISDVKSLNTFNTKKNSNGNTVYLRLMYFKPNKKEEIDR